MATQGYSFFAQNGTLLVDGVEVAAVQNFTAEVQFEANDLYSWGTIKRVDTARHEAKVNVTLEYAKFIDDTIWKKILGGLQPSTSITDTTNQAMFTIKALIPSTDGTKVMAITVSDVYFSNLPLGGELGEWVKLNLEGHGRDITLEMQTGLTNLAVTYDVNGGSGTAPVDSNTYKSGWTVTILGQGSMTPPTGKTFGGWLLGTTVYQEGQTFSIFENTTLKANWTDTTTVATPAVTTTAASAASSSTKKSA